LDGSLPRVENENHRKAEHAFLRFGKYKIGQFRPSIDVKCGLKGKSPSGRSVILGQGEVVRRGDNLPLDRNIADYLDSKGRMDLLSFFEDHKQQFPELFTIVQREMSRQVVEVPCERFFGMAGYVSLPRRSRIGVRNYERVAMLAVMLQHIFIDPEVVAAEYLRRCKKGAWKPSNAVDACKCFNLERLLHAEAFGNDPTEALTVTEYVIGAMVFANETIVGDFDSDLDI
jgi:hypothetical protein